MARPLSSTLIEAMNASESGEVLIWLMTISHPDLAEPLRISNDPTTRISDDPLTYATTSRGNQFLFVPFRVTAPDEQDQAPPTAKIEVENIDRAMIGLIRSVTSPPPTITLELVMGSSLDTVEVTFPDFSIAKASYDAEKVSLDLALDNLAVEPYPAMTFDPSRFPGLFNAISS